MKNLILIFMMLFVVDSIAQLDQREKGDVISPALNKNPNFIQKTGWTIEAIDPINDTLCSITPSSDGLTILTANVCNARVYQDINSADIRKARFDKETMTAFLKLQSLTYVKITLNVYKKAATTGTLTLLRTRSLENNSNVPLRNKKIVFDVVTEDLNFVPNANLADSLRIEFTFEPTVVFPAGVAEVAVNDFRVFSSPMNYSPLLHEVREESGWTEWQPITITAQTNNPTISSSVYNQCRKRRNGTQLEIEFVLFEAIGTSGEGVYNWSCGGLNLNGETLTPDYTVDAANVGSCEAGLEPTLMSCSSFIINTPPYHIVIRGDLGTVGSSVIPITSTKRNYRFNASIAIKEWKQSTVAMSSQNDISNLDNIPYYTASVDGTVSPSIVSEENVDWIDGDCSRTATGRWSCTVPAAAKVNPSLCMVGRTDSPADGNVILSVAASSIPTRIDIVSNAPDQSGVNSAFILTCFKDKAGFEKAWKKTATAYLDAKYMRGLARYIVKTYQSGNSWYEVNNDCWVRQGRRNPRGVVTYLIPFTNANNYTLTMGGITTGDPTYSLYFNNLTATTMTIQSGSAWPSASWVAEGYGSKTAIQALGVDVSKCQ